ncbi:MAG: tetratricopeptide repeat protein [Acidobacteria bacterium]|nr:tetratricopeptide repeat protein [Acidobacteriota bacterium]
MLVSLLVAAFLFGTSVEEDLAQLSQYVAEGRLDQAREAIRQDPQQTRDALQALITQFDSSVHSTRHKPEQRRVRYAEPTLETGIKLSEILSEVSGDDSYLRRFQARQDRITATKMLNDKQYRQALDLAQSVRKTALELEDKSFLFSTYLTSAYGYLGSGEGEKALADCETALRLARDLQDPSKQALALFNLGAAFMHLGRAAESLPYSMQAAEAAAKVGNKLWEANAWLNVGSAEMMHRRYEPAEQAFKQTMELARAVGDRLAEGRAYYDLGVLYHHWGRWEPASENLEKSLTFIREVDIRHSHDIEAYNYVEKDALEMLLRCYEKMGRNDAAVSTVRTRLAEMKEMPRQDHSGHAH